MLSDTFALFHFISVLSVSPSLTVFEISFRERYDDQKKKMIMSVQSWIKSVELLLVQLVHNIMCQ